MCWLHREPGSTAAVVGDHRGNAAKNGTCWLAVVKRCAQHSKNETFLKQLIILPPPQAISSATAKHLCCYVHTHTSPLSPLG